MNDALAKMKLLRHNEEFYKSLQEIKKSIEN